jgi:hypothetical protein
MHNPPAAVRPGDDCVDAGPDLDSRWADLAVCPTFHASSFACSSGDQPIPGHVAEISWPITKKPHGPLDRQAAARRMGRSCRRSARVLPFELVDERREMRRHGRRKGIVLVLEALPDGREPNASIASGTEPVLSGMGSVTVLNDMPTDPIVQPVGR